MFYTFVQNNTLGVYRKPAVYVCVEADNANEANQIAQKHGVYFDPTECDCCGSRWFPVTEKDANNEPKAFKESIFSKKSFIVIYKNGTIIRSKKV